MVMQRELTGKHVAMIFVGAFAVIIGVNMVLAVQAVRTFPGLEVANSYVASQEFNSRKSAQVALGWSVRADARNGLVYLSITDKNGAPVQVEKLESTLGRATHVRDDIQPVFTFNGTSYVAPVELGEGNWNIRMVALAADGTEFGQRVILHVRK